jgi:sugar lactone lactonase YvrE
MTVNPHSLLRLLPLALCAAFLMSCSGGGQSARTDRETKIYPDPPDEPRIQYLTSFTTEAEFRGVTQDGILSSVLGEDEGNIRLLRPYGIASHAGKLYICDARVHGLVVADLEKRAMRTFQPEGRGKLVVPINCAVDSTGTIFVTDTERKQVVVFSKSLDYRGVIGDGRDGKPVDVQAVDGEIWILDLAQHRIEIHSGGDYSFIRSFPDTTDSNAPGYLFSPTNMCISNDRVYVSDLGDTRVKVYDRKGTFLHAIGTHGNQFGQFVRPKGIAVDRNEILYVVDAAFENVQLFDKEGKLLMFFGGPYRTPGDMYLPVKVAVDYDNVYKFSKYIDPAYSISHLIYVTNQVGPDLVSVYGFIRAVNSQPNAK